MSRELDAQVAERIFGWVRLDRSASSKPDELYPPGVRPDSVPPGYRDAHHTAPEFRAVPAYSTSIAAAWQVVERFEADGWKVCVAKGELFPGDEESELWECYFQKPAPDGGVWEPEGHAETPALAICRAALEGAEWLGAAPGGAGVEKTP